MIPPDSTQLTVTGSLVTGPMPYPDGLYVILVSGEATYKIMASGLALEGLSAGERATLSGHIQRVNVNGQIVVKL